jgi:hypothetical protein
VAYASLLQESRRSLHARIVDAIEGLYADRIHARCDPPDVEQAEEHYRSAMALAAELEMRPLVAHCQLGLGHLHRRTGDRPKADEHLSTAASMFGDMASAFWLERAKAAREPRHLP